MSDRSLTSHCGCDVECGDDGDTDGPGICRGLPPPKKPPLVEVVLIDRSLSSHTDRGAQ